MINILILKNIQPSLQFLKSATLVYKKTEIMHNEWMRLCSGKTFIESYGKSLYLSYVS